MRLVRSPQPLLRISDHGMIMIHMVVVPDGLEIIPRKSIGVEHPSERLREEAAIGSLTLFPRGNPEWAEDRPAILRLVPALLWVSRGNAPVHVTMPARDAERHPLIQLVF